MSSTRTCPQCQQPLPVDAPEGLCPACVLQNLAASQPGEPTQILPKGSKPEPGIDIGDLTEVAKRLPQFEIIELLGRGGMGVVYKARQVQLDRVVALKILPPEDALLPDFVARFMREARSLAKLNHSNIVAVHDFGESGGLYYLLMEFVDGANLRQLLQSKKLTADEALAIVPKVCDALEYAHEEGVVHRDIKPENILVDKKGRVKIADFGLAKLLRREALDMTLTLAGTTLGTLRYMAPEQMDKPESVDHRADIYSLGVVFYEMLTGETPVGRFQLPSQMAKVDARLDGIVLHALEKEPERRYQHASEVKTDVEKISAKPQSPLAPPASSATSPSPDQASARAAKEAEAVRKARVSWLARRSDRFRTLLPFFVLFLMVVAFGFAAQFRTVNEVSSIGWPSPWLVVTSIPGQGLSCALHSFTFSFCCLVSLPALTWLGMFLERQDCRIRYGLRFRDLQPQVRRRVIWQVAVLFIVTICAPILIGAAALLLPGASKTTLDYTFIFNPKSKAYEALYIKQPFFCDGGGTDHYLRPRQWDMSIGIKSKNEPEAVWMNIEMPSLKANYIRPKFSKVYPINRVLDLAELTEWMREDCHLDMKDAAVQKEAAEVMALLKHLIRRPPATYDEFEVARWAELTSFPVESWLMNVSFGRSKLGNVLQIYLASAGAFLVLYLILAARIKHAAFRLNKDLLERGEGVLAEGPLPKVSFGKLPHDLRRRTVWRAGFAALGLMLLPAAVLYWNWGLPDVMREQAHFHLESDSPSLGSLTMTCSFDHYQRDGDTFLVDPKLLPLELNFSLPGGAQRILSVELPGLRATWHPAGRRAPVVTLDKEELTQWFHENLAPPLEPAQIEVISASLMDFLKLHSVRPPSTRDALLGSLQKLQHFQYKGMDLDQPQHLGRQGAWSMTPFLALIPVYCVLLYLLKRSALRTMVQRGVTFAPKS